MTAFFISVALIIFSFALIYVTSNKKSGMAVLLFSIYHIFFYLLPGLIHQQQGFYPFYNLTYQASAELTAAIVVALYTCFFWLGYLLTKKHRQAPSLRQTLTAEAERRLLFVLSLIALCLFQIALVALLGVDTFVTRRSELDREAFGQAFAVRELMLLAARSASFACLFLAVYFRKSLNNVLLRGLLIGLSTILFFIINYPLALPRFVLFSYIIFVAYFYYPMTRKNKWTIVLVSILGITTIFPLASHLTRGEGSFEFRFTEYYSRHGDFDGFQSTINTVLYVRENGLEHGHQLVSSALALIPRAIWTGKARSTGEITSANAGYDYTNISAPLPAELYIDFGYLGVTLFSLLLGMLIATIDNTSHTLTTSGNVSASRILAMATVVSFLVIISRGPLLGAINNVYIQILIFVGISSICKLQFKHENANNN